MNRTVRPVQFAFEPDVVSVFLKVKFGTAGAPTLDATSSKGICGFNAVTWPWTATVTSSSTNVTAAESLYGVYNGMAVTGTDVPASTTISAVDPAAATATLSQDASATHTGILTFSGGQYQIQFGLAGSPQTKLDTYPRLLGFNYLWDSIPNEKAQTAASPSLPAAPSIFLIQNLIACSSQAFQVQGTTDGSTGLITGVSNTANIYPGMAITGNVATDIPTSSVVTAVTATTVTINNDTVVGATGEILTLTPQYPASLLIQCGTFSADTFLAANPASGEILRLGIWLTRSTAI